MYYSKHKTVDKFTDNLEGKKEDQIEEAMQDLENQLNEDVLDTVDALAQENNLEGTPLLHEEQQELRSRVRSRSQRPSGPDPQNEGPEAQQPEESFCQSVLRQFQRLMGRLQQTWQEVLTWAQKKLTCLQEAVKTIWNKIKSFCSSMAKNLSSLLV